MNRDSAEGVRVKGDNVKASLARPLPRVSVIIPTHGRPGLLRRAIDSVRAQTVDAWELLVIDDNEPRSAPALATTRLLAEYGADDRIHLLKHARNRGGAAARNTGIRAARANLVAFLDDDDTWQPEKLERQLEALEAAPRCALVYTGRLRIEGDERRIERATKRGRLYPEILRKNHVGSTSSVLCRRDALFDAGLFDESLAAAQDFDLFIRLAKRHAFECIDEPLVHRHVHAGARITAEYERKIEAYARIARKHESALESNPRLHAAFLVRTAKIHIQAGYSRKAAATFRQALRVTPDDPMVLLRFALSSSGLLAYTAARYAARPLRLQLHAALERVRRGATPTLPAPRPKHEPSRVPGVQGKT